MQANFVRVFYTQVCQTLFDCDKLLFSFLLAYKELEVEFRIDRQQVEFFIKGALQQESEIFAMKNKDTDNMNEEEYKNQMIREEERAKKRQKITPWITQTQWKAIDKLSQIPPFNSSFMNNPEPNLAAHIEKNPRVWFNYINGNQLVDYTMAQFGTKDDDGNSVHSSDEDPISPGLMRRSVQEDSNQDRANSD